MVALALCLAVAAGCAGGKSGTANDTTAPTSSVPVDTLAPPDVVDATRTTVLSLDNDYRPKHLQVRAGTTVTFENVGRNKHNIIPDDPQAADFVVTEQEFPTGATFDYTFTEPGVYTYYCTLHATPTAGSMRGVITVTP